MSLSSCVRLILFSALGLGVTGCGKPPAPPIKEVAAPAPALVAAPAPVPEARLPAVTGNGKFARPPRELVRPPKAPPSAQSAAKPLETLVQP